MSIKDMSKDELELFSHKDLTNMLLTENGSMNTVDLFKEITRLLELPNSFFENKIGDFYTTLTTDKRFIMLDDGNWDLREHHTSDKIVKVYDTDEDEEDDEEEKEEELDIKEDSDSDDEEDYDTSRNDEDFDDSSEDDLKDLVIIDEDELELEE